MTDGLRVWFLVLYALGIVLMAVRVIPARRPAATVEREVAGGRRSLPAIITAIHWLVPAVLLLLRVGELARGWPWLRAFGVALSVYAVVMLIAMVRALGSLLVLRAVVFSDHHLVTTGPFRMLRHPGYSAALALWLGAGLGTMSGPVLILWPLAVAGTMVAARAEDELLHEKFGLIYDAWAEDVGEFVPRFGAKRAPVA